MAAPNICVKKICPAASELSGIKVNIPCPEEGCNSMFQTSSNLDMHLIKHHRKKQFDALNKDSISQFHCPVDTCSYKMGSERFFKSMKYLKQHYLKAHAEKNFLCKKCDKGFSTESAMKYHHNTCGIKFMCSCYNSYGSYEALLTHAKRTLHAFDRKLKFCSKGPSTQAQNLNFDNEKISNIINHESHNTKLSLTTVTVPVQLFTAVSINELPAVNHYKITQNKEVQTEVAFSENKRTKKTSATCKVSERPTKRRTSAQTQTGCVSRNKQPKISAQTQTIGDHIIKKAMKAADIQNASSRQVQKRRRNSMETQTQSRLNVCDQSAYNKDSTSPNKSTTSVENDLRFPLLTNNFGSQNKLIDGSQNRLTESCEVQVNMDLPALWCNEKGFSNANQNGKPEILLENSFTQPELPVSFLNTQLCPNPEVIHAESQNVQTFESYFKNLQGLSQNIQDLNEHNVSFSPVSNTNIHVNDINTRPVSTDSPGFTQNEIESILLRNKSVVMNENQFSSIETQTEIDFSSIFLSDYVCDNESSLAVCANNETQTTEDSSLDRMIYSNTYTQTCDVLFPELDFVDIETQTAWPLLDDQESSVIPDLQADHDLSSTSCFNNLEVLTSEMNDIHTQTDLHEFDSFHLRNIIAEFGKNAADDKIL